MSHARTPGIHHASPLSNGSPFHEGERAVQERLGVRDVERWARRMIVSQLPEQHRLFHTSLPFVVAAARDHQERPWVTLLAGDEGFITSPDPRTLLIHAQPVAGDALANAFAVGTEVGLLGIELDTRRRNRANGRVSPSGDTLVFRVDQAFGNCPQYIHQRAWQRVDEVEAEPPRRSQELTASQMKWIGAADTFFIASGYRAAGDHTAGDHSAEDHSDAYGMDASHRGGDPGFVRVENSRRLVFPDYAGNNLFNTIGNLAVDPRVGVTFIHFETGSLLQLTGIASIDWDSPRVAQVPNARRLVSVDIHEVVELPRALRLRWFGDSSVSLEG